MKKEKFKWMLNDGKTLIGLFIVVIIIFKIVYYKDSIFNAARFALSLFWVYVLPGFFILSIWKDRFDFLERFIGGFGVGAAIVPLIGYNLALVNIHLRIVTYGLPAIIIIACLTIIYKKYEKLG